LKKDKKLLYAKALGNIFVNFSLNKNNSEKNLEASLKMVREIVDCFLDDMHPKVKGGNSDDILRRALSQFIENIVRKIGFCKNENFKKRILEETENLMTRVVNFGIYRNSWEGFNKLLTSVCLLNSEKFLNFILERIKIGLKEDQFQKLTLLGYLGTVAGRVCESEKEAESLYWMIPTMLRRLDDTSHNIRIFHRFG